MKFYYLQSDNNILEKRYICYNYFKRSVDGFGYLLEYLTDGFDLIIDILNLYLNSTYFDAAQKNDINNFKIKIIERKMKVQKY